MKYVLSYTVPQGGSAKERREAAREAMQLLEKYHPDEKVTMHQWVTRLDGNGGFSIAETDDLTTLLRATSTWGSFLDFTIYPVMDIQDAVPIQLEGINATMHLG